MEKEQITIFYSWQSDIPENRNFIEDALKRAIKELKKDDELQVDPAMDRDTKGIAGSPDISKAIFEKIAKAQVFVCDVSIINQKGIQENEDRPTPNPNVLVELGYALGILTYERIIMVTNTASGDLEQLPFDLRIRRTRSYCVSKETSNEECLKERKKLVDVLKADLKSILIRIEIPPRAKPLSKVEQAMNSIRDRKSNQGSLVKSSMQQIAETIEKEPLVLHQNDRDQWLNFLLAAIDNLHSKVLEFTKLADCIVQEGTESAAHALYSGFGGILNLYTLPPPTRNTFIPRPEHDLAKFLGYELFVIFFALLIKHEKWDLIGNLLDEELYARARDFAQSPGLVPFYDLNQTLSVIRPNNSCLSPAANILAERYIQGDLLTYLTIEEFANADFFLYLRALVNPEELTDHTQWRWLPICWPLLSHFPAYLQRAQRIKYANHLVAAMGVNDIPDLRRRLEQRTHHSTTIFSRGYVDYIMGGFDYSTIGTR